MLTYGAVVAGGLGFWRYEMIRQERAARIMAENRAIAIQQQAEAERQQFAEERRQADKVRLRLVDIISALAAQQRRR